MFVSRCWAFVTIVKALVSLNDVTENARNAYAKTERKQQRSQTCANTPVTIYVRFDSHGISYFLGVVDCCILSFLQLNTSLS